MSYCTETYTTQVDGSERLTCSCGEFVQREPSMTDNSWMATRHLFERCHATFAPTLQLRWLLQKHKRVDLAVPHLQQCWVNSCQERQWRDIQIERES